MRKTIAYLFLTFSAFQLEAQYVGSNEISDSDVKPWVAKIMLEYEGIYKFGESESESTLRLFFADTLLVAQVHRGYWEEGTDIWLQAYEPLFNSIIDKSGNFTAGDYRGRFVIYTEDGIKQKGLKIDNPWTDWIDEGSYEVGIKSKSSPKIFSGKYSQASSRYLKKSELEKMDKASLKIMRNEIFARYGFEFKKGDTMGKYFATQSWYEPQKGGVTDFFTALEIANISLIKEVENMK